MYANSADLNGIVVNEATRQTKRFYEQRREDDVARFTRQKIESAHLVLPAKRRSPMKAAGPTNGAGGLEQDVFFANKDVVSHIVSFLDIKSLYKFTMTSKKCTQILRHDHVVKAALYQGGHAKSNLERVLVMIRGPHRILVPTPLRFLRLCVGRLCECCQQKRVNFVSQHFGVFFCKECLEKEGYVVLLRRFDPLYKHVAHLYVIPEGCHAIKVWARPYVDGDGDLCGPLFSLESQMKTDEISQSSLTKLREKNMERRKALLPLIENAYKKHLEPAHERLLMEQAAKYMASVAAQQKKIRKIKLAIQSLSRELGNVPWKSQVLAHQWVEFRSSQRVEFSAPMARSILRSDMSAPSRLTKARIRKLASLLRQGVTLFEEHQLHDFSFFSDSVAEQRALKEVCRAVFPNYSLLSKPWVTPFVLEHLRELHPERRGVSLSGYLAFQLAVEANSDEDDDDNE
ncbi:hypothetical protein ACA910_009470 [Epithemia clementina (nom. ined.)]